VIGGLSFEKRNFGFKGKEKIALRAWRAQVQRKGRDSHLKAQKKGPGPGLGMGDPRKRGERGDRRANRTSHRHAKRRKKDCRSQGEEGGSGPKKNRRTKKTSHSEVWGSFRRGERSSKNRLSEEFERSQNRKLEHRIKRPRGKGRVQNDLRKQNSPQKKGERSRKERGPP